MGKTTHYTFKFDLGGVKMAKDKVKKTPTIENRKAYHDYFIEETLECGIELKGNEVKVAITIEDLYNIVKGKM